VLLFMLISVFGLSGVSAQTETSSWKLTGAQSLEELLGEDYDLRSQPILAPDGSALAWGDLWSRQMKIFTLADRQLTTYPWPKNFFGYGPNSLLSWSPDSQYLTFNESFFFLNIESDIWMLDLASGEYTDRTDDGVMGNWSKLDKAVMLDYLSVWNPADGDLYFFRSVYTPNAEATMGLYFIPRGQSEPQPVRDLTADVPTFSIYTPAAISPDGKRLAFSVQGGGDDYTDPRNGFWTLDLETGTPQQVGSVTDFKAGLPAGQSPVGVPTLLPMWTGNDTLVVLALDPYLPPSRVGQMAYYVNLGDNSITPLSDFSDVTDMSGFFDPSDDLQAPVYRVPRSGVVSPDGKTFIFLRHSAGGTINGHAGISTLALPPNGSTPVELGDIDNYDPSSEMSLGDGTNLDAYLIMSADGKALMNGYLFQFEPS
jgi:hypothetical protein